MSGLCPFGRGARRLDVERLTDDDKRWLGTQLVEGKMRQKEMAQKYHLKVNYLQKLRVAVSNGTSFAGKRGRPASFSLDAKEKVAKLTSSNKNPMREKAFLDMTTSLMHESARERQILLPDDKAPSQRTLKRLVDELKLKNGNAEVTTNARAVAVASVRNAVAFAVMNAVMVPKCKQALLLNPDGTTMTVGIDPSGLVKVFYSGNRPASLKVLPEPGDGGLLYSIKFYLLINGMGDQSPPIYVIQDKAMEAEALEVHKVPGLGLGTNMEYGYVLFCHSRCGNLAFYKWFITEILCPWVLRLKEFYELDDEDIAWLQMDGEPIQLECMSHPDILKILEEALIFIGKLCASTTEVEQPCDKECFKGPKTSLKTIDDNEVSGNTYMIERLGEVLKLHFHRMSPIVSSINPANKRQCIYGLLRVQLAFMRSLRKDTIIKSWRTTGIFPFSLTTILANCSGDVTPAERDDIESNMPELMRIFIEKGELMDSDFDSVGIRNGLEDKKDHLVVYRRRAVMLTHKAYLKRESDKVLLKIGTKEKKMLEKLQKKIDAENKLVESVLNSIVSKVEKLSIKEAKAEETKQRRENKKNAAQPRT
jgi:hypothetical protein